MPKFDLRNVGSWTVSLYPNGAPKRVQADPTIAGDTEGAIAALKALQKPQAQPSPAKAPPMLSAAIDAFLAEAFKPILKTGKPKKGWDTDKAQTERPHHLKIMCELLGDVPLSALDRTVMEDAWHKLQMLPPHASTSPKWRDKPLPQIIEKQAEAYHRYKAKLAATAPDQRHTIKQEAYCTLLSESTVNNYLWTWSEFCQWAAQKEYLSRNHCEGLQLERDKTRSFRRAFTTDELLRIFESDFYKRGKYDTPSKYWVPMLLLYSGGRLNEFCQLLVEDIVEVDDIWCIKIWDSEADRQRLKNQESRRLIPIHSKILAAGFLDYVVSMRKQKSRRLFPELDTGGEKSSKYLGNWWGRYLKKVGVKERGIDAHSFRHTAVKVWLNSEVDERWAAAICGQGYKSDEDGTKAGMTTASGTSSECFIAKSCHFSWSL